MSLVNQQTGTRQGNANYVFYKLAAQQPTAFHDVPSGSTIAMPCAKGSPNCTIKTNGHQYGVLSGFSTTTGYDLATGLGSVNAANMVNQWSSVTFKQSATTLSLSPTTITHGQSATLSASVTPASGSGTPTGNFSLLTSTGKSVGDFALSGGSFSGPTKLLPGGTYTVNAHYGGDSTFGGSDSTPPISVTVNKESSKTVARLVTFDGNGNIISGNAGAAPYGSFYLLRVDLTDAAGDLCGTLLGCPGGNVVLTDNGSPLDAGTYALNNLGYTEDLTIQLTGGAHSLQAQYPGDASFTGSTGTDAVTITPATTSFYIYSLPGTVTAGSQFYVTATVNATSNGAGPGGTFAFTLDGSPLSGSLTTSSSGGQVSGVASIHASFLTSVPTAGTHTLVANYSGDANYSPTSSSGTLSAFYSTTLGLTASTTNPPPNASVTLTTLVDTTVKNLTPTGTVNFFDALTSQQLPGSVALTPVTDGNGNSALQATLSFVPPRSFVYVNSTYSGDSNFQQAYSDNIVIQVAGSDFSFFAIAPNLYTYKGAGDSMQLQIDGQTSYTGTIDFTPASCSGLPAESTCSFTPTSVTGSGTVSVLITTTGPHSNARVANRGWGWWSTSLGLGLACIFLLRPLRGTKGVQQSLIGLVLFLIFGMACGGGGGAAGGGGGGGPTDPGTPKGTYTITVTATSGGLSHNATFNLIVQ
jgi:hypothetical protein